MIQNFTIKESLDKSLVNTILDKWKNNENKVFHLKSLSPQKNIRDFQLPSFSKEKYQTFCGT